MYEIFRKIGDDCPIEQLINKIIEIENMAQDIIAESLKMKGNLKGVVKEEADKMRASYLERAKLRLEKIKANETEFLNSLVKEMEQNRAKQMENMNDIVKQNEEKWINDIFNKIIGG